MKKSFFKVFTIILILCLCFTSLIACDKPGEDTGSKGPDGDLGGNTGDCKHGTWKEITLTKAPSMTETGILTRVCDKCGKKVETEMPVLSDVIYTIIEEKLPTCKRAGYTVYAYDNGYRFKIDYPVREHEALYNSNAAYHKQVCFGCKQDITDYVKHEYTGEEVIVEKPTCDDYGVKLVACKDCGVVDYKYIKPLNHDFDETTGLCKKCGVYNAKSATCGFELKYDQHQDIKLVKCTSNAEEITIPDYIDGKEVYELDPNAFAECTNLKKIYLPKHGINIFSKKVNVPDATIVYVPFECDSYVEFGHCFLMLENKESEFILEDKSKATFNCNEITTNKDFNYVLMGSEIALTAYKGGDPMVIPAQIDGKDVAYVSDLTFTNPTEIKSVKIDPLIDRIDSDFLKSLPNLKELDMNTSSISVLDQELNKLTVRGQIISLGFVDQPLKVKELVFGKDIYAAKEIYLDNNFIEKVSYEEGCKLRIIGENTFGDLTNIKEFGIPKNTVEIAKGTFRNLTSTKFYTERPCESGNWASGYNEITDFDSTYYKLNIVYNYKTADTDRTRDSKLVTINNINYYITRHARKATVAFQDLKISGNVVIPDSFEYEGEKYDVEEVDRFAFRNCKELTGITFPSCLKKIEMGAFYGCDHLNSLAMNSQDVNNDLTIVNHCVYDQQKKEIVLGIPSTIIGNEAESIKQYAFAGRGLTGNLTIPKNIKSINEYAFINNNLDSVDLSNMDAEKAKGAFVRCNIKELIVPKTGDIEKLFTENYKMAPVTLDKMIFADRNDVTIDGNFTIDEIKIKNSNNITSFIVGGSVNKVEVSDPAAFLAFEKRLEAAKQPIEIWSGGVPYKMMTMPANVTTVNLNMLRKIKLDKLILPSTVTKVDNDTFKNIKLEHLVVQGNPTWLYDQTKDKMFKESQIKEYSIPAEMMGHVRGNSYVEKVNITHGETITNGFTGDISQDIHLPYITFTIANTVKTIGEGAFMGVNIKEINMPNNLTTIGNRAFESSSGLKTITIPNTVTSIGEGAFCSTDIREVKFAYGCQLTKIEADTFANCPLLTEFILPPSVIEIGVDAFMKNPGQEQCKVFHPNDKCWPNGGGEHYLSSYDPPTDYANGYAGWWHMVQDKPVIYDTFLTKDRK